VNARIHRLFGLVVLLFGLLVGFTSYWSVFDAEGLEANRANQRPLLEEQRIRRGLILARDGTVLARNRVAGRGAARFYRRIYPADDLFSHPVGYNFVQRGRAAVPDVHDPGGVPPEVVEHQLDQFRFEPLLPFLHPQVSVLVAVVILREAGFQGKAQGERFVFLKHGYSPDVGA
jgi:hypothetical protein